MQEISHQTTDGVQLHKGTFRSEQTNKGDFMNSVRKASMQFFLALALVAAPLAAFQLLGTEAMAQSSYFSSRGCTDCHSAPVASTCAGCHEHSGSLTATKNKTTAYAPGETVTITLTSSGARSGWIGVRLYDQTGAEIARSAGSQSGMGGSAVYPAVLSAPAPATAGSYTWRIAYLGNENGEGGGDVHSEKSVNVPVTVASAAPPADTAAPVVTFTLPATATSLTVPVANLSATDNVAVTGYLVNKVATPPAASATGWTAAAPASVTAVAGSNTFYAWAKDAAGNVSAVKSATVVVSLPDTAAPVVTFTLPATATSLTVPVASLSATDNVAVTGYLVNKVATPPAASATGWTAAAPASVTAVAGSNTFYAWAKDAAGNVSAVKSATVVVSLPDTAAPVVTFTLPATATSLTVPVASLSATDNIAVTGYLVNKVATPPAASATGWTAAAPASVTAVAGSNTFYAWAKDAAGNVSAVKSATVVVSLPDTAAPVVTFSLPATATNLTIVVSSFSATDNVAVTGYLITTSATVPAASAAGWTATPPASVTAVVGSNTFYAWAKDAVGNVSAVKSATVVVSIPDTIAPVVSFILPATSTSLTVPVASLSASDNVAVTGYLVNKVATPPAASAAGWTATAPASVTAVAGSNTFYAWAKDAAGNVSAVKSASVTVTTAPAADTTLPTLTISALANGSYTNKVTLNVSGTASDASGIKSVTVNGQLVIVNADGSFSHAVTLAAGANTITTIATDTAGNQQVDARTVTYDLNIPVLAVTAPADNGTSVQSFINVTGTISEAATVSVSVNSGSPQTAAISGSGFSATVNLLSGVNTIDIIATDLAGNTASAKRTVTYDNSNSQFTLAVTSPAQDITTRNSTLTIRGTVVDATSRVKVTVTMNGRTYTPYVYDGTFRQRLTFTRAGLYAITVTATDNSGNKSTVTRNVIYRPESRDSDRDDDERDDD